MKIIVLASGRGSNFRAIVENIEAGQLTGIEVAMLLSDKPDAKVLQFAADKDIPHKAIDATLYPSREVYEEALLEQIKTTTYDLVVLAGYMKVLGAKFLEKIGCPVVNIHPALLPSFPGLHAQKQALDYGVKVSGCTVHFVDAELDHGPIIGQSVVQVEEDDTEESLSSRILVEEHKLYSRCLQQIADGHCHVQGRQVKISGK